MRRISRLLWTAVLLLLALATPVQAASRFVLPKELTIIEAEAFRGASIDELVIPEGTLRIETGAFADCGIQQVTLPDSLAYIAPDAFGEVGDLRVKAPSGSYGERWAKEKNAILIKGLGVQTRTQGQIRSFIAAHPADTTSAAAFRQQPEGGYYSDAPYAPGLLDEKSIADGINMLNQLRYIAGLNANVVHDASRETAQGAISLVNALNGGLSHYPDRPAELGESQYDALYALACQAGRTSNLSAGRSNLAKTMLGYVQDDGASNQQRVGHRRWLLNPAMGKTCFGYYYSPDSEWWYYSSMYAFDESGSGREQPVAWPAQQTPLTHFIYPTEHAWSLSFNRDLDADDIFVTLNRSRDGKTWRFSSEAADGAFYVNNQNYGQPGCVIFLPDGMDSIKAGDVFRVTVEDRTRREAVQYTVTFFNP